MDEDTPEEVAQNMIDADYLEEVNKDVFKSEVEAVCSRAKYWKELEHVKTDNTITVPGSSVPFFCGALPGQIALNSVDLRSVKNLEEVANSSEIGSVLSSPKTDVDADLTPEQQLDRAVDAQNTSQSMVVVFEEEKEDKIDHLPEGDAVAPLRENDNAKIPDSGGFSLHRSASESSVSSATSQTSSTVQVPYQQPPVQDRNQQKQAAVPIRPYGENTEISFSSSLPQSTLNKVMSNQGRNTPLKMSESVSHIPGHAGPLQDAMQGPAIGVRKRGSIDSTTSEGTSRIQDGLQQQSPDQPPNDSKVKEPKSKMLDPDDLDKQLTAILSHNEPSTLHSIPSSNYSPTKVVMPKSTPSDVAKLSTEKAGGNQPASGSMNPQKMVPVTLPSGESIMISLHSLNSAIKDNGINDVSVQQSQDKPNLANSVDASKHGNTNQGDMSNTTKAMSSSDVVVQNRFLVSKVNYSQSNQNDHLVKMSSELDVTKYDYGSVSQQGRIGDYPNSGQGNSQQNGEMVPATKNARVDERKHNGEAGMDVDLGVTAAEHQSYHDTVGSDKSSISSAGGLMLSHNTQHLSDTALQAGSNPPDIHSSQSMPLVSGYHQLNMSQIYSVSQADIEDSSGNQLAGEELKSPVLTVGRFQVIPRQSPKLEPDVAQGTYYNFQVERQSTPTKQILQDSATSLPARTETGNESFGVHDNLNASTVQEVMEYPRNGSSYVVYSQDDNPALVQPLMRHLSSEDGRNYSDYVIDHTNAKVTHRIEVPHTYPQHIPISSIMRQQQSQQFTPATVSHHSVMRTMSDNVFQGKTPMTLAPTQLYGLSGQQYTTSFYQTDNISSPQVWKNPIR